MTDGKQVPNFAELESIYESMGDYEDNGMQVQFWLASGEDIKPAVEATQIAVGEMADFFIREEGRGDEEVETSSDEEIEVSGEEEASDEEETSESCGDDSDYDV